MKYLKLLFLTLGMCASLTSFAEYGDEQYKPTLGQEGKDIIWIPTEKELIRQMLETARVGPDDLVYDLGAGDGVIAITAATDFGARAVGIEYNPNMAALAGRNATRAGVQDRVKFIHGDIFVEDFSKATVVSMYLFPELNLKLRPLILKMKPGTRVVSHAFNMGDWLPDKEIHGSAKGYYWVVPANIMGEWHVKGIETQNKVTLTLNQRFQKVGGILSIGNMKSQPILSPYLEGNILHFGYIDRNDTYHKVNMTFNGSTLIGVDAGGPITSDLSGKRIK